MGVVGGFFANVTFPESHTVSLLLRRVRRDGDCVLRLRQAWNVDLFTAKVCWIALFQRSVMWKWSVTNKTYNDQWPLLLVLFGVIPPCTTEEHFAETSLNLLANCHSSGSPFSFLFSRKILMKTEVASWCETNSRCRLLRFL